MTPKGAMAAKPLAISALHDRLLPSIGITCHDTSHGRHAKVSFVGREVLSWPCQLHLVTWQVVTCYMSMEYPSSEHFAAICMHVGIALTGHLWYGCFDVLLTPLGDAM